MKKLLVLIFFSAFASKGLSQSFHLFSFVDSRLITHATDNRNLDEMARHLHKLLALPKADSIKKDPTKSSYDNLLADINKIQKGDVILFYFGGEGDGNSKDENIDKDKEKQFVFFGGKKVSHGEIVKIVSKQKPQMAIILIEGTKKQSLENEGQYVNDHAGIISKASASQLFKFKLSPKDEGTIFYMNATEPPKPAQKNKITGSYFLASFKNNLYNELGESNPSWDKIRNNVETQVKKFTRNVQTPYGSVIAIK